MKSDTQKIMELRAALEQATDWFDGYADSHTRKGDVDKAKRNLDRSDHIRKVLEDTQ